MVTGLIIQLTLEYVQKVKGKNGLNEIASLENHNKFREYSLNDFKDILEKIDKIYDNNLVERAGSYVYQKLKRQLRPESYPGINRKIKTLEKFLNEESKHFKNALQGTLEYTLKEDSIEIKIKDLTKEKVLDDFLFGYFKAFIKQASKILHVDVRKEIKTDTFNYKFNLSELTSL